MVAWRLTLDARPAPTYPLQEQVLEIGRTLNQLSRRVKQRDWDPELGSELWRGEKRCAELLEEIGSDQPKESFLRDHADLFGGSASESRQAWSDQQSRLEFFRDSFRALREDIPIE